MVFDDDDEAALFPPTSSDDELPAALADAEPPEDVVLFDREDSEIAVKLDGFFGDSDEKAADSGSESAPSAISSSSVRSRLRSPI